MNHLCCFRACPYLLKNKKPWKIKTNLLEIGEVFPLHLLNWVSATVGTNEKQYIPCIRMHTAFKYSILANDIMGKKFLDMPLVITNHDHENWWNIRWLKFLFHWHFKLSAVIKLHRQKRLDFFKILYISTAGINSMYIS